MTLIVTLLLCFPLYVLLGVLLVFLLLYVYNISIYKYSYRGSSYNDIITPRLNSVKYNRTYISRKCYIFM